ncbi:mechanosensitive ion channel family protein [Nitratifractor sp.]|uniref:mechanosensitive ion channel family protein n=1 Tax=Nitratifractor sp. TaxID=2268144 RepID=UPI0025F6A273|nr:mechanosensitive ion channel family protein [Nitratifractor sp.]
MANTNVESNTTAALQEVTQSGKEVIKSLDQSIVDQVQPLINKLYASHYGRYFADTIYGVPVGNWIAAILAFLMILLLRKLLTQWVLNVLQRLSERTATELDNLIIRELKRPIRFLFVIIGFDIFFKLIFLSQNHYVELLLTSMLIIDFYWILYALTPAIQRVLYNYSHASDKLTMELSNFIIRILRLLVIILALISLLYNFGINVTAFVASLGLVGMALALAAKDTAANLFGSIALMLDRSIRVGEWIKVNGVEGIVEDIGMRTTKIRTFEKSFVVVPNSIVANSNIENFSRRGIRRIRMVIGLTYDTPPEAIQKIVYSIQSMLRSHPGIAHDQTLLVRFDRFDDSSLGIFIYTFTNTSDWARYLEIREDINLKIMQIVREFGSDFAFPSQSIYVEKIPKTPMPTKQTT